MFETFLSSAEDFHLDYRPFSKNISILVYLFPKQVYSMVYPSTDVHPSVLVSCLSCIQDGRLGTNINRGLVKNRHQRGKDSSIFEHTKCKKKERTLLQNGLSTSGHGMIKKQILSIAN